MHFHRHLNHADDSGMLGFIAHTYPDERFHYFECNENHDALTSPFNKSTSFAGSSNGLICLEGLESDCCICICNPITREYVMLPKPKEKTYVAGFGYVSSTGEYKVLGLHHEFNKQGRDESEFAEVYVYTLGSGKGWRNLGNFISQLSFLHISDGPGIFANEALYWLDCELEYILTLDLAEEKFCDHLSLPSLPQDGDWCHYGMGFCILLVVYVSIVADFSVFGY
ncbi:F-box protein At5g49610-like [Papaver somniferum]|uniref:F-box protein At5g49610-like n=1 Tax=Papaver somniferum TaxID=3469 RepID=UPI000E6F8CC6|nr:F-box protein At5g49610-like [Papaver somniferum]